MFAKLIGFLLWTQFFVVWAVCPILVIILGVYVYTCPVEVF